MSPVEILKEALRELCAEIGACSFPTLWWHQNLLRTLLDAIDYAEQQERRAA